MHRRIDVACLSHRLDQPSASFAIVIICSSVTPYFWSTSNRRIMSTRAPFSGNAIYSRFVNRRRTASSNSCGLKYKWEVYLCDKSMTYRFVAPLTSNRLSAVVDKPSSWTRNSVTRRRDESWSYSEREFNSKSIWNKDYHSAIETHFIDEWHSAVGDGRHWRVHERAFAVADPFRCQRTLWYVEECCTTLTCHTATWNSNETNDYRHRSITDHRFCPFLGVRTAGLPSAVRECLWTDHWKYRWQWIQRTLTVARMAVQQSRVILVSPIRVRQYHSNRLYCNYGLT